MTSEVEVTHISQDGFGCCCVSENYSYPRNDFPWFKQAPVSAVLNVQFAQRHHLYWPDLDIDLAVESIQHPERFPLVAK